VPLSAASSTHPCPTSIFAARAPFRRGAARITQASTTRAAMSAAGEEATIVGLTSVMRPDDYLIGTYRAQPHGAQVGRRGATLRAAPAAPRPRRRARARRRAAERHPAPARPREPRHHLGLPPRHRHRGDHRHGPRATRTDDVRQRWTPDLKDRRRERPALPLVPDQAGVRALTPRTLGPRPFRACRLRHGHARNHPRAGARSAGAETRRDASSYRATSRRRSARRLRPSSAQNPSITATTAVGLFISLRPRLARRRPVAPVPAQAGSYVWTATPEPTSGCRSA
jgi:hypothetical protein